MSRHPNQGIVVREIQRPDSSVVDILAQCPVAFILDHMGKHGVMSYEIKPLRAGTKLCGPAITVLGPDVRVRQMAIDLAFSGDVLVVAADGIKETSCFGAHTAEIMQRKGIAGAVIDGATRDAAEIRDLDFPTFVKAVTPRNYYYYESGNYGGVNVEVCCGGQVVHPGDVIVGDDDGVVVVPRETAEVLSTTILEALKADAEKWLNRLDKPFNVEEKLRARGYKFV